jgi:hypothetical protein
MGLLFLLSAYFTVASCDRKGGGAFLRDRFLRLGIPLLFFDLLIQPSLACTLAWAGVIDLGGSRGEYLRWYYTTFHLGNGPLWFVEVLLIFSLVYAAGRACGGRIGATRSDCGRVPGMMAILIFAPVLGVLSFVARLWFPVNWAFGPLNLQLAFFVQYIAMLSLGVIAYRRDWLARLPTTTAAPCLVLAGLLVLIGLPLLLALGGALEGQTWRYLGGPHWQAFAYAMWEQMVGVLMIVGLLILFRERVNCQGPLAREASAGSYTVYIIHTPVVILVTLAVRDVCIYPLLKFALVALVTVPMTFALGAVVRRLPLARRIL